MLKLVHEAPVMPLSHKHREVVDESPLRMRLSGSFISLPRQLVPTKCTPASQISMQLEPQVSITITGRFAEPESIGNEAEER